ncbi:NUDIX domain-containing protein [Paenarthrobacter sp. Z7-10]|uniref:NUDIX hydrolase n=1 Tax=Paenarthrobacter sp. Z7-10 TaxID=2787635 RepID=UPI0022A93BDD|nr:NUDIX domain-containing protein [Paenarthrobacter sp. Z7-10]MCZ2403236.1 NUDIX domain-containing protein [Paenarthrobacter sp. Z7-10]
MPTPDFVLKLREKIGHDLLWLPGVTAVVFDDDGRVLLGQRADTGRWTLITGMLDPGEEPAIGAAREVLEETGVTVRIESLVAVHSEDAIEFPNGDKCQFMNLVFRGRAASGQVAVGDDESLAVGWFELDALPELAGTHRARLQWALDFSGETHFQR